MLTIKEMYDKGIIKDGTIIYINVEDEELDKEYTIKGRWYQDHMLKYNCIEMDTMRIYKDRPDVVWFNYYK